MVNRSAAATTNTTTGTIIARLDMRPLTPGNQVVINARPEHCRGHPARAHRQCSISARCAGPAGEALSPGDPLFAGVKTRRLLRPVAPRPKNFGIRCRNSPFGLVSFPEVLYK